MLYQPCIALEEKQVNSGCSLLAIICLCCVGKVSAQTAGEGTAFTLSLPYLTPSTNGGAEQISLLLTSQQGSSVTIRNTSTGTIRSVLVPANSFTQLSIDTAGVALPYAEGMFRKSLQVQADNPITATVMLDRGTASEAYTAIADSLLGLEYIAVGNVSFGPGSFMVVAATEDQTTVTITPNLTTLLKDDVAGVPFTIQLNKGEVYQLLTKPRLEQGDDDDLTGTHIVADRPVAVWSGVTCSRLPIGNETCGPLIEQLPSVDMFGTRHLLGLYSGERLTYWRAVSLCRDTRIASSELLPEVDTVHAGSGRTTTRPTVQNGEIVSSQKALVVHLGVNVSGAPPRYVDSAVGDPTMGLVVPVEQMYVSITWPFSTLLPELMAAWGCSGSILFTLHDHHQRATLRLTACPFRLLGTMLRLKLYRGTIASKPKSQSPLRCMAAVLAMPIRLFQHR